LHMQSNAGKRHCVDTGFWHVYVLMIRFGKKGAINNTSTILSSS
jgi:hypothetical protein